jgi:hypothetical protein
MSKKLSKIVRKFKSCQTNFQVICLILTTGVALESAFGLVAELDGLVAELDGLVAGLDGHCA